MNNRALDHFSSLLPELNNHYITRNYSKIRQIFCRTENFMPYIIGEWIKFASSICQAPSYSVFCEVLLDFVQKTGNIKMFLVWKLFVLVLAISENKNLNIISKILWIQCANVPLKHKTRSTFLCGANIVLIDELFFLMTLTQLTWSGITLW